MHRNVTRHLPRQCPTGAPPATSQSYLQRRQLWSIFDTKPKSPTPSPEQHDDPKETTGAWRHDPEEAKKMLQALDQKNLLETKIRLNALIKQYEATQTTLPKLLPSTIRAAPSSGNENPTPYTLSAPSTLHKALPSHIAAATSRMRHMRSHIEDLQTADYIEPGDGLAAWKEEVEGMTAEEKRDKLKEMRLEEEAELNRLMVSARRNLEVVRRLSGKGEGVPVGVSGRKEAVEVEGKEGEGGRKAEVSRGGITRAINIGRAREKAVTEKAEEKPAEKPAEEGNSLMDMQRRLSEELR